MNNKVERSKRNDFPIRRMPRGVVSSREMAYHFVFQVKYEGAYSNILLNQLLKKYPLEDRERGFFTELGYGTLEKNYLLDRIIDKFSKQPLSKLSSEVIVLLELGLYQIRFMDSVTEYAAVDETVELAKKIVPYASGFINGILRSVLRDSEAFCLKHHSSIEEMRVNSGVSADILKSLLQDYGEEKTREILKVWQKPSPLHLRVNCLKETVEDFISLLEAKAISANVLEETTQGLSVSGMKRIDEMEEFNKGLFSIQNSSSQLAVEVLGPKSGEKILDICACPGGKTAYIGEKMENKGLIEAWDISHNKLPLIQSACKRLGIENVQTKQWDARKLEKRYKGFFDRVLLDAPCSGIGVIGHRPEIRFKTSKSWADLPSIQSEILENAAQYVKDGGVLLYSTCTLRKQENREVMIKFLMRHKEFMPEDFQIHKQSSVLGMLEIFPRVHGADGFFIAKIRKKEK